MPPTTPGAPLNEADAAHVEATLVRLLRRRARRKGEGRLLAMTPRELRAELGWTMRRHADLRAHLERHETRQRLSERCGRSVKEMSLTRTSFSVVAGKVDDAGLELLGGLLSSTFFEARKLLRPSELREWVGQRLELFLRK